jgi:hypothetical protein
MDIQCMREATYVCHRSRPLLPTLQTLNVVFKTSASSVHGEDVIGDVNSNGYDNHPFGSQVS